MKNITWLVLAHYRASFLEDCVYSIRRISNSPIRLVLNQPTGSVAYMALRLMQEYKDVDFTLFDTLEENGRLIEPPETISRALNQAIPKEGYFIKIDEDYVVLDKDIEKKLLNLYLQEKPIMSSCIINMNDFGGNYLSKVFNWTDIQHPEVCPGEYMKNQWVAGELWKRCLPLEDFQKEMIKRSKPPHFIDYGKRYGCGIFLATKKDWDKFYTGTGQSEEFDLAAYLEASHNKVSIATNTIAFHRASSYLYDYLSTTGLFEKVTEELYNL